MGKFLEIKAGAEGGWVAFNVDIITKFWTLSDMVHWDKTIALLQDGTTVIIPAPFNLVMDAIRLDERLEATGPVIFRKPD